MSGFANDGNFLAKFLTAQQRVAARAATDPAAAQPVQQQLVPPPPPQQQQQQQWSWAHQQPQPYAAAHYSQSYPQPWPVHTSGAWTDPAVGFTPVPSAPPTQYQQPSVDVLAAAGWRKESTPEGVSFWVNDITGETRETEPPQGALVVSVHRTTRAGVGTSVAPASAGASTVDATAGQAIDPNPSLPPPPPPPGVTSQAAAVMAKLATRVVRNSRRLRERGENANAFEELIKQKNTGDPTFSFLFHVGSIGNVYYETLKRFEMEAGPEAAAQRKAAEEKAAKAERRRRRWGPATNESSGEPPSTLPTAAATTPASADQLSRRSAWDIAPEASDAQAIDEQAPAAESTEPHTIEWEGVSIGTDGWRQFTLVSGRTYFHRAAGGGNACEVTWDRPVAKNHTTVDVARAAAEPTVIEQPKEKLPAVGPVGGVVTRQNTGASAKDALAAAVSRKRARVSFDVAALPATVSAAPSVPRTSLGYGGTALGTGGRAIKSLQRMGTGKVKGAPPREVIDSVKEMRAQLATVVAAIARAPGQTELLSLRSNLLEAIALASAGQGQQSNGDAALDNLEVAPSSRQTPAGSTCSVLCAMPDGTGLWCRAVTLAAGGERANTEGGGVLVRIITPVCEDYQDREHQLQPTALRPDFEIIPQKHLKEGARVLAPHTDGLWYSARVVETTNADGLRARNKLQVKFDEYRELYTVPLDEVIPRVSTHEQTDDDDMAAVYKRRRREDKEKAARDAARVDGDEDGEEISKGVRTLDGEEGAWEQHTRGIGSRLMSKMGHVPGQPLGASARAGGESSTSRFNLTKPIEIRVLPPGRSLDFISEKPKKKKKAKDSYRNTSTTEDMFSFLNTNVAEATISNRSRGIEEIAGAAAGGRGGDSKTKTKKKKTEADLRLELVQKQRHHRELIVLQRDLKQRLARNADAPGMYRAIQNKADQVAAEIQASTASQQAIEQKLKIGKEKKKISIF